MRGAKLFLSVLGSPKVITPGALRAEKASRSGVAQRSSGVVRQDIIYKSVCRLVLVVAVAARQKELRVDEVIVLAAELKGVLASCPRKRIRSLVAALFLKRVVTRPNRHATKEVVNSYVRGTSCAGIQC